MKTISEDAWKKQKTTAPRCSHVVSNRSTKRALRSLTLEIERDPVWSTRYGRSCKTMENNGLWTSKNPALTEIYGFPKKAICTSWDVNQFSRLNYSLARVLSYLNLRLRNLCSQKFWWYWENKDWLETSVIRILNIFVGISTFRSIW